MNLENATLIQNTILSTLGVRVSVETDDSQKRNGLRIYFEDLGRHNGPVLHLRPHGLKRHKIELYLGQYAGSVLRQIKQRATSENYSTARAILHQLDKEYGVEFAGNESLDTWQVTKTFKVSIKCFPKAYYRSEESLIETATTVLTPLISAMAELIGYDKTYETEGQELEILTKKRERSRNNRLLALRIHGHICFTCGLNPKEKFGEQFDVIEIHHVEPLSELSVARVYDPHTDLIPLCPNCHRLIHTRMPAYTPDELKIKIQESHDQITP